MDLDFNSIEELYNRLQPALLTKKEQMRRNGYSYIKKQDIWNYLRDNNWKNSKDLSLYQMVSDILNTDDIYIDSYVKHELKLRSRSANLENIKNDGGV